ncbi:hypothetical protein COOONC_17518 [Cooperia oncophora]
MRLTELGKKWGAVSDGRWFRFIAEKNAVDTVTAVLKGIRMSISKWTQVIPTLQSKNLSKVLTAYEMLYRHNVSLEQLRVAFPDQLSSCLPDNLESLEKRLKCESSYELAHERMKNKMKEIDRESSTLIPEDIDYSNLQGLSGECWEKLERARPLNLAAASRSIFLSFI